jgi:hypothetical protein
MRHRLIEFVEFVQQNWTFDNSLPQLPEVAYVVTCLSTTPPAPFHQIGAPEWSFSTEKY